MDLTFIGWLFAVLVLGAIAARVYLDPIHGSRTQRVLWAVFSGVLPLIGYFAFLICRYCRSPRPSQAVVR